MHLIRPIAEIAVVGIEAVGILVITASAVWSMVVGARGAFSKADTEDSFKLCRKKLGRGILLGLEFLVAADIVNTVAVELSFRSVGILSIIVLVRTFLSVTLEMETTGRWPWARPRTEVHEP
jgi:uncharacterized membrane protein